MITQQTTLRNIVLGLFLLTISQMALPHMAHAASISGNWRGGGTVTLNSGAKEYVRCRVRYGRTGGKNFSVNARCATASGKFVQVGNVRRVKKNRYIGTVRNTEFNISARVVITVRGKSQGVSLSSSEGSAKLRLKRR